MSVVGRSARRHSFAVAVAKRTKADGTVTFYVSAPRLPWWRLGRRWRLAAHIRRMLAGRPPGCSVEIEYHRQESR